MIYRGKQNGKSCRTCKRTDKPQGAHGLDKPCNDILDYILNKRRHFDYMRRWREKYPEKHRANLKKQSHAYYLRSKTKILAQQKQHRKTKTL